MGADRRRSGGRVHIADIEHSCSGLHLVGQIAAVGQIAVDDSRQGKRAAVLVSHEGASKVAAIGYCFGGTMSLELARNGADLKAVVGFHSGLSTTRPDDATNIIGSVLVCIGAEDPMIPPEQRLAFEDEMRAGGVD
jgi:dienelactone hydrolase